jgi:hypothetical protein
MFGGIWILVQQCLCGDKEARRTNTTLEGGMFKKLLLQRM